MDNNISKELKEKLSRHLDDSYVIIRVGDLRELIPELHALIIPLPKPRRILPDEIIPLPELERRLILEAYQRTSGNLDNAAELVGISKRQLYRKLKDYGITREINRED